jgi:zinc and cadmium transporter
MKVILWIILSTVFVSLLSFIGVLFFIFKENLLKKILLVLVSLSAGALMGGAFLHLIPESTESSANAFAFVLIGFILFFFIEKILHWRHCHKIGCKVHTFAYMNLFGDAMHNLIDGLIIAAAFITNIPLGIATTLAVTLHEIPQELGDFGVLIHGGFKKMKALFLNFLFGLTAILGGIIGYFLSSSMQFFVPFLLPFAAGGFIYIAASDLMPELRKETNIKKAMINFAVFLVGIIIMYGLKFV